MSRSEARPVGRLYVVATPIGNLEDITLRALRILRQAQLIAAEDTRRTKILQDHYEIRTPTTSYHQHNLATKTEEILEALQRGDVALVSEAGMPAISDPGYELVRAALARGIRVVPVPGPSALISALAISGLPTDGFVYLGFLPRKASQRRRALEEVAGERRTLVAFEAPHRLLKSLRDVREVLGDRELAVARELTKLHEEVYRGRVSQALAYFGRSAPRGEITLVLAGRPTEAWPEAEVRQALQRWHKRSTAGSEAVREVARLSGWPRQEVYRLWLGMSSRQKGKPSRRTRNDRSR